MILAVLLAAGVTLKAQEKNPEEYLGLPGDNLNLYAVLKVFQESKTLEAFEKAINDENNKINNLDLNNDNLIDYLMVFDEVDGDVHNIVLRVAVSKTENQDIAVITVQRNNKGEVYIQVTGDDALYGKNYIIEPIYDDNGETPNPGYTGDNTVVYGRNVTIVRTSPVYVSTWPIIHYMYDPGYSIWSSSWYWGYYPVYWRPWRPYYWHYYYGFHYQWYNDYYRHYRRWDTHRYSHWDDHYYVGRRVYSPSVTVNINQGHYRSTYSRPELRAEGEATYYENQASQGRRGNGTSVSGGNVNRQNNTTGNGRANTNTGVDRRTDRQGSTTDRNGEATNSNRSVRDENNSSNIGSTRRTENSNTRVNTTKRDSEQRTTTQGRSSNQVSDKPATRTEKNVSSGTSNRSSSASSSRGSVKSAERKSSTTSKSSSKSGGSATSSKKSSKSESAGSSSSTRRK